jgi:hypothetical protein
LACDYEREPAVAVNRSCGGARVLRSNWRQWNPEIASKEKYGVTAHSRLVGKEIELNCNTNFV